jgi:hypothetical protein
VIFVGLVRVLLNGGSHREHKGHEENGYRGLGETQAPDHPNTATLRRDCLPIDTQLRLQYAVDSETCQSIKPVNAKPQKAYQSNQKDG